MNENSELRKPAVSEAQRVAAATALAAKRGQKDPKTLSGAAKAMYDGMTEEQLEHYAREVKKFDRLSNLGLQRLHLRLHQLYATRLRLSRETEDVIVAHAQVVEEIGHRGAMHYSHGTLDELLVESGVLEEAVGFTEAENQIRYRVREPEDFRPDTFRTIQLTGTKGVSSIIGKLKPDKVPEGHSPDSMVVQAIRFDKDADWTKDKARKWVEQHSGGSLREALVIGDLPAEATQSPRQGKVKNPQVELQRAEPEFSRAFAKPLEKRDSQRYTLSIAYPVNEVDAHGETAEAEAVEEAAWWYLRRGGKVGFMHDESPDYEEAGDVVESYVYRGPSPWRVGGEEVNAGDWLVGVVWQPKYWEMIERGEMVGVSIHGVAQRKPA